jgi:asparagine synthase (glutamine-hydrolysing)
MRCGSGWSPMPSRISVVASTRTPCSGSRSRRWTGRSADPRVHAHLRNPLYDEASVAEAQATHVGATYRPIPITGREIANSFADAIWHSETQMFNGHGVAKYLLSRAVRAAGIKVVFTGEGADEMLGGYPYFRLDTLDDNAALRAAEKAALRDEMLDANPATLNFGAAQTNNVAPLFRTDLR